MAKGKRRSSKPNSKGQKKSESQSESSLQAASPQEVATPVTNGTLAETPTMEQIPESANDTSEGVDKQKADDQSVSSQLCRSPDKDEGEAEPKIEPTSVVKRLSRWVSGRFGGSPPEENGAVNVELSNEQPPDEGEQVPDAGGSDSPHAVEANGDISTPQKSRTTAVWSRVKDVFYTPFSPRETTLEEVKEEKSTGKETVKEAQKPAVSLWRVRSPPKLRVWNLPQRKYDTFCIDSAEVVTM